MTTETRSLHRKLAEVMAEVERIPKRGKAPAAMGGFEFVQVGDAADAIRKALAQRKVSMIPSAIEVVGEAEHSTKSGGTMTTMSVRTTWTLTDGETGEEAVIQSLGTGADTGDKFAPKAQTNAMKYALLMGFLLSTGDDPEQTDTSDRQARQVKPAIERDDTGGLIGVAELGKGKADFNLRETPDGMATQFRLVSGRSGIRVDVFGTLAVALESVKREVIGQRVTCWGSVREESFMPKGARNPVTFKVLRLERIQTPDWTLPASEPVDPEHDDDPPTAPLWSDIEADLASVEA